MSKFMPSLKHFGSTEKRSLKPMKKPVGVCSELNRSDLLRTLIERIRDSKIIKEKIHFNEFPKKIKVPPCRLRAIVASGIYSLSVLRDLVEDGMSDRAMVRAMKYGLFSLDPEGLEYFQRYNLDQDLPPDKEEWRAKLNEKLIENLLMTGLTGEESWNILINGLAEQSFSLLHHLILSGIDVPGILNWHDSAFKVSPRVLAILRQHRLEDELLKIVEESGIDEEIRQKLEELVELEALGESAEDVACFCSSTATRSDSTVVESTVSRHITSGPSSSASSASVCTIEDFVDRFRSETSSKPSGNFTVERNNYLRQNVMVALAWAMGRLLHYRPTDPQYYLAYQLLRWSQGCVSEAERNRAQKLVAAWTEEMDDKLIMRKLQKQEENRVEESLKKIPCDKCKNVKRKLLESQGCRKCGIIREKYEACELAELCSACQLTSKADREPSRAEVCELAEFCSSCSKFLPEAGCEVPHFCSTCKISRKNGLPGAESRNCELPEFCSSCNL